MAGNQDMPKALVEVADSMARAVWTFIRNGADFHQQLSSKIRKVAESALSGIDGSKD